ncbi:amidohydrolase family protein [Hyphococcus luteus]|uniref:amidohydrolase family protein n=1 Tax=Hyphococcus luteus TaxID=2058213 RepID=UPI0013FDF96B|nr:amidohydrolase family protein [Marinicaulis flavus]
MAPQAEQQDPLFDAHAHFFTNDIAHYPINTANAREGEENIRKRIVSEPATPEAILPVWEKCGVVGGAGVQYNTVYKTDNSYIMDVSDRHPDKISSVVILHADAPDTPATLEKMIVERNVVGLRLYGRQTEDGTTPWLDSPEAHQTWRIADKYRLNMVLMYSPQGSFATALPRIAALARTYPATRISLDHFGWPVSGASNLGLTQEHVALTAFKNIYFKLSTINFNIFREAGVDCAEFLRNAVDVVGADHIMWGSDQGNTLEDYGRMAQRAREAASLLTKEERRKVLCETGKGLFARKQKD